MAGLIDDKRTDKEKYVVASFHKYIHLLIDTDGPYEALMPILWDEDDENSLNLLVMGVLGLAKLYDDKNP